MSIKGEGGSDALMEKSILNFHFDYFSISLTVKPELLQRICSRNMKTSISGGSGVEDHKNIFYPICKIDSNVWK